MARAVPRVSASDSVKREKKVAEKAEEKSRKARLSGQPPGAPRRVVDQEIFGKLLFSFPLFPRTSYRGSRGKADVVISQLIERSAERFLHHGDADAAVVVTAFL